MGRRGLYKNKLSLIFMIFVISLSAFTGLAQNVDAASPGKTLICHNPPGNSENPQNIEVGGKELNVHLRHGDTTGSCGDLPNGDAASPGKTLICHNPPGNPDKAHEITVGEKAVDAHLRHGDTTGSCEGPPLDSDGDGIPDVSDACPDEFGLAELNGCPPDGTPDDTDGDGVPDVDDLCPDEFGLPPTGCPPENYTFVTTSSFTGVQQAPVDNPIDTVTITGVEDLEGIFTITAELSGPQIGSPTPANCIAMSPIMTVPFDLTVTCTAGGSFDDPGTYCFDVTVSESTVAYLSSSDKTQFGLDDEDDECFTIVVDSDGDGIPDGDDLCPDEFGLAELNGCPPDGTDGDMDGDGVPDVDDLCPDEFGLPPT
ncbi:MAG TPA: hypothetical protein VMW74_05185, partial [Nitrosopumilaceae archaeon]|nr:hypothetical protein [Nitrosopumilaceae archaeon]